MSSFPKRDRILKPSEFNRLRNSKAGSCGNRYFGLRWLVAKKKRLGIVVSKKVDKATKRNLIKRIIRDSFRLQPEIYPAGDVVVIARPTLKGLDRTAIREALQRVLKKVNFK